MLLPPASTDQGIDSDDERNNNILNEEYLSDEQLDAWTCAINYCRRIDHNFVPESGGGTYSRTMVNLSVVAAYKFYNHINLESVTHIEFRREIARAIIKVECPRKRLGGPTAQPSKAVRFDGIDHSLESVSQ